MAWVGNLFRGTGANNPGNEFVGQLVQLGEQKLKIKKVIAEGGYGFVFVAQDLSSGKEYALKRLMAADDTTSKQIVKEVSFFRKLRGHPNIVQYVAAASGDKQAHHGMHEYLILTELCTGKLIDLLNSQGDTPLEYAQVLKIFAQTCRAVAHMHKQVPPIIHRDLKAENLLFNTKGVIKLCDFGSATTATVTPTESWTALQRSMAEDEIQQNTTPMYRAPEMIDLYSNNPITVKSDVWALGCVLYMLCFKTHPFDDSAKLKIMNANYTIPEFDTTFQDFHHLIRSMLKVNPTERPDVEDIYAELVSLAEEKKIDLKSPAIEERVPASTPDQEQNTIASNQANGSSVLLGNALNKAGALFSNIKDASSKMMQSVAGYVRHDLDISYITSRLLVMSFPADGIEGAYKNNIEDVRTYLDSKHTDNYVVINISQRNYRNEKLNDRVYESGWNPKRAPPLSKLISLCRKLNNFLKQNKKNVVVVHCLDGKVSSSVLLQAFFLFCKLFPKSSMAEDLFHLKRSIPGQLIELTPSQRRYIGYVGQLVASPRYVPHKNTIFLKSLSLSSVPIFNKARTGCRPFIEIYEGDQRVMSTAQEIEQMREYTVQDERVVFQTHVRLNGDVTIMIHHGRSTLGGKVQGKLTSINILTLQFHTGFMMKQHNTFTFSLPELDIQESIDKYSPTFGVTLNMKFTDEVPENTYTEPWEKMHIDKLSPYVCFSTKEEYWQLYEEFGLSEEKTPLRREKSTSSQSDGECFTPREPVANNAEKTTGNSSFFSHLDWSGENDAPNVEKPKSPEQPVAKQPNAVSNEQVSNNLIDIGSAPKSTNMESFLGNSNNISPASKSPVLSDSELPQIDLVDPFAALATPTDTNAPADSNILLNFDTDHSPAPDLLNNPAHTGHNAGPDLLAMQQAPDVLPSDSPKALRKNRSLDDLNHDDFFSNFDNQGTVDDSDLLGHKPKQPFDPFMKHHHEISRKSNSESNLLGDFGDSFSGALPTLTPEQPTLHHSASANSIGDMKASTPADPFADFGNLNFGSSTGGQQANFRQQPSAASPMNQQAGFRASPTPMMNQKPRQPMQQQQPQQAKAQANYNVFISSNQSGGVFGGQSKPSGGGWAPKPVSSNQFDDILNSQGFKTSSGAPKTLKQMRDAENIDTMDPITRKVREWSDGKERNIRALISSLHTVLWEGEDRWKPIGMHQLIKPDDVKRWYKRACLAVHPDKRTGTPEEDLARAIFVELNDSYRHFVESGAVALT